MRSVEATDNRKQSARKRRNASASDAACRHSRKCSVKHRVAAITGGLALGTLIFIAFLFALRSDLGPNITYHVYQAVQPTAEEPEVSLDLAPRMR